MQKIIRIISLIFFINSFLSAQTVTLENSKTRVLVSLDGGKILEFRLKNRDINPIHTIGHFICYDRWGPSSDKDIQKGIPWHGEASHIKWQLDKAPLEEQNYFYLEMSAQLPIVKLSIKRKIFLEKNVPVFKVVEKVTNQNSKKQRFNLVQHPTIGSPFLDETTIVDTKVEKGFDQSGNIPPSNSVIYISAELRWKTKIVLPKKYYI